jgi:hypothetical protein
LDILRQDLILFNSINHCKAGNYHTRVDISMDSFGGERGNHTPEFYVSYKGNLSTFGRYVKFIATQAIYRGFIKD